MTLPGVELLRAICPREMASFSDRYKTSPMFSSLPPLPSFVLRVLLALGSGLLIAGLL